MIRNGLYPKAITPLTEKQALSEFKARPVYLNRKDCITAHFMTCFIALIVYSILEKRLKEKYLCEEIINTIKNITIFNKIDYSLQTAYLCWMQAVIYTSTVKLGSYTIYFKMST